MPPMPESISPGGGYDDYCHRMLVSRLDQNGQLPSCVDHPIIKVLRRALRLDDENSFE